jgi:two-component system chemotaxis response regulator CheY
MRVRNHGRPGLPDGCPRSFRGSLRTTKVVVEPHPKGAILRALVIDDSRAMRALLGRMLKGLGFEVSEAGNGREGLQRLKELGSVDLALVDWNMPEMNGFDFLKAVRSEHNYDGLLLMMVTTETEMGQVARALEAGANEYVMKPFTPDVIVEKLRIMGIPQS